MGFQSVAFWQAGPSPRNFLESGIWGPYPRSTESESAGVTLSMQCFKSPTCDAEGCYSLTTTKLRNDAIISKKILDSSFCIYTLELSTSLYVLLKIYHIVLLFICSLINMSWEFSYISNFLRAYLLVAA